ncbi:MAG TPA: type II toxin-antitoxin system VapC family toxin [Kineosporiaceae bacterium]
MIVLDTNVVSELMRVVPAPQVVAWLQHNADRDLATTAVTVAEIRYGITRLPSGRRRATLAAAADEIFTAFPDQILPFDLAAAHAYADIVSHRDGLGTPIEGFDAQIAAICRTRAADLATRNEKDFTDTGITIINPWQPDPAA